MKTIGFIGLGLIGGSIAKAIRKYHEDYRLLAYDQDRETLAAAVSSNMNAKNMMNVSGAAIIFSCVLL